MMNSGQPAPESNSRSFRGKHWLLAGVAVAVIAAGVLFFPRESPPEKLERVAPGPPGLAADECRRLLELKNVAVSQLENGRYELADAALVELAEKLPGELLGPQNLAICRLLATSLGKTELSQAQAAAEQLLKVAPGAAVSHWVAGRVLLQAKDKIRDLDAAGREARLEQALNEFSQAVAIDPQNLPMWYELYQAAATFGTTDATKARARDALARAIALAPQNLFLLGDWLVLQAEARNPELAEAITTAKAAVQPAKAGILQLARVDAEQILDRAQEAVGKQEWPQAVNNLQMFKRIVRPGDYGQSDKRQLERHPLEYVLHDFRDGFCQPQLAADAPAEPQIAVQFTNPGWTGPVADQAEVRDIQTVDFDLDGRLDLVVLSPTAVSVFGRPEKDGPWQLMVSAPLAEPFDHLLIADLDRDTASAAARAGAARPAGAPPAVNAAAPDAACHEADPDIVAYGAAGVVVLRNELEANARTRVLQRVAQDAAVDAIRDVITGVLGDIDHDGDLDLVLSTKAGVQFWSARGNMTFSDLTGRSQLPPADRPMTALLAVDWDRDIDLDFVAVGPTSEPGVFENLRHGQFRWQPFDATFDGLKTAAALALLDADGNVSWDLIAAGEQGIQLVLTTTPTSGVVRHLKTVKFSEDPQFVVSLWDFNNDGYQDLLALGKQGRAAFQGAADGRFTPVENLLTAAPSETRILAVGDLDGDGDEDLAATARDRVFGLTNEGGNKNHWLDVRIRGADDQTGGRVNHYGVASLIELRTGPRYDARVVAGQTTHIGLGARERADVLRVLWTNGVPEAVVHPQPDQVICEVQTLLGSCPYLYAWNGNRFEFVTDLLWAAPLGLQFADGVVAPNRPWEYLLIPGENLKPQGGAYRLQLTEELWEAAYFDQVELIAVDHPAEVEVFSNEKVGPADIARFQIHTASRLKTPVAARNQAGRNLLDAVRARDGVYARVFDRQLHQGLTENHYLELDLGPLDHPRRILLYLTGWIYPSDTSLNVGYSQNPELPALHPPALLTPDAAGQWREVRPYLGFPGGKTKTIVVDLSDAFPAADYRLRIATNLELYWDAALFTVDEQPVAVSMSPLRLLTADLHYRGFSHPLPKLENSPEVYDYQRVDSGPKWPPMRGHFTRYGDVAPLLAQTDDRLLIIGSGDEASLEFAAPADPPPAGWRRDFILHNVGWDKDAVLNTVYGQTVEPLPFQNMTAYPYPPGEFFPDSPEHRQYLNEFQTRIQDPARFWRRMND